MIFFETFVPGRCVPKGRPRYGKFGVYTPAKTRAAEAQLKYHFKNVFKGEMTKKPLKAILHFFVELPKKPRGPYPIYRFSGDSDNLAKTVLDAMNSIIFADDQQIISLEIQKRYATETHPVGTHIILIEIPE